MDPPDPPRDVEQLMQRAEALAGRTFAQVAASLEVAVPADLRRHKGWVGNLMELALGATAASRDEPDFVDLGIELKTLPVDRRGRPCETTFVCTIPLSQVGEGSWEDSRVFRKLARVLWLIIQGDRDVPLAQRRVGSALLWSPSAEQQQALRADWEELAGLIGRGDIELISARLGQHLQIRPKAANSRVRRRATDAEGMMRLTMPRGFYLRTSFTGAILTQHFAAASRG